MEVLEVGKGFTFRDRCSGKEYGDGGCNSLLLVSKDDLYFDKSVCDGNSTRYVFAFQRPVCSLWTEVDDAKIPYNIKKELLFDDNGAYKPNIRRKTR